MSFRAVRHHVRKDAMVVMSPADHFRANLCVLVLTRHFKKARPSPGWHPRYSGRIGRASHRVGHRPASAPWPAESGKRVQVFTPYPGRIIALYASVGDDVKKGQTLFTIGRPRSPAGRVHSDPGRGRAAIEPSNGNRVAPIFPADVVCHSQIRTKQYQACH